ncbi:hypothetical protein A9Q99_18090 [Gammaproteobacteria bacterium 45_16_T64]|nr:hypothetical protein A9Q99_18090 [Gammaproteobacteria bacterium 45_16_T64]
MNVERIGKIVTAILCIYFVVSGFDALINIDEKLERIGLIANGVDGKIAFILIYTSLMVGVALAMMGQMIVFRSSTPPLIVASAVLLSFIVFRIVGSVMFDSMTSTQLGYIVTEMVELIIVVSILWKNRNNPINY